MSRKVGYLWSKDFGAYFETDIIFPTLNTISIIILNFRSFNDNLCLSTFNVYVEIEW